MKIDLATLARAARRAHQDEEGSSMVFGALTLFTLALFTLMVYVVGINSSARIQNQSASDGAALSGALVEAEALESIAFLNDGMAYVYYAELRYTIDAIVYSTLELFNEHDNWVMQFHGDRTQPEFSSPGVTQEVSVGGTLNNPGANRNSGGTYSPGLEHGGNSNPDYSFVEMGQSQGGGETFFEERYRVAKDHYQNLVPKGRQWLQDIHWAERVILAATPAMVRKACITVAQANNGPGTPVAVSELDKYFKVGQDGGVETDAFTDGSANNQNQNAVDGSIADRYTTNRANPIDQKVRDVPSWFDKTTGAAKTSGGYEQTRICWNKRDWDHTEQQSNGQAQSPGIYDSPSHSVPADPYGPSGHWHVKHTHIVDLLDPITGTPIAVAPIYGMPQDQPTHDYGHGIFQDGGVDDPQHDIIANANTQLPPGLGQYAQQGLIVYDPAEMNGNTLHHQAQTCPTCGGQSADGQATTVTHTEQGNDGAEQVLNGGPFQVFEQGNNTRPRPIRLKPAAFQLGVSVATWRPGEGFDATVFPANDFGNLAIASAEIGIRNGQTVAVLTDIKGQQAVFVGANGTNRTVDLSATTENLFLGDQGSGLRFGARLVPVRRDNSWGGTGAASGLQTLVNGSSWFTSPTATTGSAAPAELQNLGNFVNVAGSAQSFPQ